MKRIVSVSRRTDIPAFYGDWFLGRLKEGFAGYIHPFGGWKRLVSLEPSDVVCFVFWSKNFAPFLDALKIVEGMGYSFYFNYTITGLPRVFETNLAGTDVAIAALKELSRRYSPKHINWRYDPIVVSSITDRRWHMRNFSRLAAELEGYVERCYFSYPVRYGKVRRSFERLRKETGVEIFDPDVDFKIELAGELAEIAEQHGIEMFSCCGDYLLGPKIKKARCIDGDLIRDLFGVRDVAFERGPTREGCGCTYSVDIGAYDTCPHGCVYCYANANKKLARSRFRRHDRRSAFLGYTEAESDRWLEEMRSGASPGQRRLFDDPHR